MSQTKEEVDFVVMKNLKVQKLVQVCYNINDSATKNREITALIKAGEEFKCNNLLIITDDYEAEEIITGYEYMSLFGEGLNS